MSLIQPLKNFVYIGLVDIIDILLVAFLLYKAIGLVKETRAQQVLKGIIFLLVLVPLSEWLRLDALNYILVNVMQIGIIAIIIVFQPELRRMLEKVGRFNVSAIFKADQHTENLNIDESVNSVCAAAGNLSLTKTGALIVIERETKLGEIAGTGTMLDAALSSQLLENIFFHNSPLHDGAIIVRSDRVVAAACYLPLTEDNSLSKKLGTRHRAGIGISETADCVVVIVSEETGSISLAISGKLETSFTPDTLKKRLLALLMPQKSQLPEGGKAIVKRVKNKWKKEN
ncbi:MAG: diadenylate cyclase CdaA [Clostridia bacterium]|nr:diadenylate cyclase CdaA [Clostridia bacterium]